MVRCTLCVQEILLVVSKLNEIKVVEQLNCNRPFFCSSVRGATGSLEASCDQGKEDSTIRSSGTGT